MLDARYEGIGRDQITPSTARSCIPGHVALFVLQCSCHTCAACMMTGRYAECEQSDLLLGPAEIIQLEPDGGASVRLTLNILSELGVSLSRREV